jgi:hypothetical protein
MKTYLVKKIPNKDAYPFLLNIHYAKRIPSITYAFGLFLDEALVGVITYGTPPSSTLRVGVAGKENADRVLELNRLCLLNNLKNEASFLISKSLKMLPKDRIIVSNADASQGHIGTVYQATNFNYYGLSAKRTDWKLKGHEHLHNTSVIDMTRGMENRAQYMRDTYGDDFYLQERPRKHRYVLITSKAPDYGVIKYKKEPYPKKV